MIPEYSETQKPKDVYAALSNLRAARSEKLAKYVNLATAICVVHDRPLEQPLFHLVHESTPENIASQAEGARGRTS